LLLSFVCSYSQFFFFFFFFFCFSTKEFILSNNSSFIGVPNTHPSFFRPQVWQDWSPWHTYLSEGVQVRPDRRCCGQWLRSKGHATQILPRKDWCGVEHHQTRNWCSGERMRGNFTLLLIPFLLLFFVFLGGGETS